MRLDKGLRLTGTAMLVMMLGGCLGGLVGGGRPDALYRFGVPAPVATTALAAPRRVLAVLPVRLPAATAGDRILTIEGGQASYVKDVRWVSPASVLFDDAIRGALTTRLPDLAIVDRVTARQADRYLTVRIDTFEARYASADSPPLVVVEGQAILADPKTREIVARLPISEREQAAGPGAAMLTAAFDAAVRRIGVEVADWANGQLPITAAPPGSDGVPARNPRVSR